MTLLRSPNFAGQVRIALLGYGGRMGQAIAGVITAREDCSLASGLVRTMRPTPVEGLVITTKADEAISLGDVVIDFTLPDATADHLRHAVAHKKPFMCGTTGLGAAELGALKQASAHIPVLHAPNTSLSLAATRRIVTLAAQLLGKFDYDVAILDEHHRMKKDAPSGTAKALGEAVLRGNDGKKEPSYAAIRAGHIVGEHEVTFAGEGEMVRIRHSVTDRAIFARGAVQAALWLHDKPRGFYGMDDVLGI